MLISLNRIDRYPISYINEHFLPDSVDDLQYLASERDLDISLFLVPPCGTRDPSLTLTRVVCILKTVLLCRAWKTLPQRLCESLGCKNFGLITNVSIYSPTYLSTYLPTYLRTYIYM